MSGAVTVIVPTALRQFAGGKEEVRLAGGTVGDVLTQLTGEYPDLKQHLYKDDGRRKEAIAEFRRYLELRPDAGDLSTVQDDIYYLQEESRRAP